MLVVKQDICPKLNSCLPILECRQLLYCRHYLGGAIGCPDFVLNKMQLISVSYDPAVSCLLWVAERCPKIPI